MTCLNYCTLLFINVVSKTAVLLELCNKMFKVKLKIMVNINFIGFMVNVLKQKNHYTKPE